MRIGLFILGFILLEVASFIIMADLIGGGYTLGLVCISIVAGALLLRQLGLSAGFAQMQAMRSGQLKPGANAGMPMYLWLVGLLLIIPGFFSDLLALLLLIPQVRTALTQALKNAFLSRAGQVHAKAFHRGPANEGVTLDGECSDIPEQNLPNKNSES
jgi:UPF0716 protein FxsA